MEENIRFEPFVSIIIPVYNGSNYMQEAIDSALAQTYKNIEIVVVNDGSNDNGETDKIAKKYGEKIVYITKKNGGVSTALNIGIKNMRGEYFSWLSHDDLYTPEKIEKSVQALKMCKNKKTIISCQSVHIDKNSKEIKSLIKGKKITEIEIFSWENALMYLMKYGTINGCSLLIHKEILFECGLFDEGLRFNQDGFMWNKIFINKYSIMIIPEICVKNRIHDKQLTQTGQDIFHKDCEKMSEFLIPKLLEVSSRNKNFIVEYIKYNGKYGNFKVVENASRHAKEKNLVGLCEEIQILIWKCYGGIRPLIKCIYYKLFRKI